jgi:hypothetical protein
MTERDGIQLAPEVDGGLRKTREGETIAPMTFQVRVKLTRRGGLRVVTMTVGRVVTAIVKVPILIALLIGVAHADEKKGDYEAKVRAAVEKGKKDPKVLRMAWSARLCSEIDIRAGLLRDIAKENKYTVKTGVTSYGVRAGLREELEAADQHIALARRQLAEMKVKPQSCKDQVVSGIADCMSGWDDAPRECTTDDTIVMMVDVLERIAVVE